MGFFSSLCSLCSLVCVFIFSLIVYKFIQLSKMVKIKMTMELMASLPAEDFMLLEYTDHKGAENEGHFGHYMEIISFPKDTKTPGEGMYHAGESTAQPFDFDLKDGQLVCWNLNGKGKRCLDPFMSEPCFELDCEGKPDLIGI